MSAVIKVVATGMEAQQARIETIAHNLANVNTPGYKTTRAELQDKPYMLKVFEVQIPGTDQVSTAEAWLGTGVTASTRTLFGQGSVALTTQPTDVAVMGDGFFKLVLPDGNRAYTRNGSFMTDSSGQLVTSEGYPLDPPVMTAPGTKLRIDDNGEVKQVNSNGEVLGEAGTITLTTFVNPEGLRPLGRGMYVETAASGTASTGAPDTNGRGKLVAGSLEQSTVIVADEMVNMLEAQRAYQIAAKAVSALIEMVQEANEIQSK